MQLSRYFTAVDENRKEPAGTHCKHKNERQITGCCPIQGHLSQLSLLFLGSIGQLRDDVI